MALSQLHLGFDLLFLLLLPGLRFALDFVHHDLLFHASLPEERILEMVETFEAFVHFLPLEVTLAPQKCLFLLVVIMDLLALLLSHPIKCLMLHLLLLKLLFLSNIFATVCLIERIYRILHLVGLTFDIFWPVLQKAHHSNKILLLTLKAKLSQLFVDIHFDIFYSLFIINLVERVSSGLRWCLRLVEYYFLKFANFFNVVILDSIFYCWILQNFSILAITI